MIKRLFNKNSIKLVSILLFATIIATIYAAYITKTSNDKTISTLSELATQNKRNLELVINNNLSDINDIAHSIEDNNLTTYEDMLAYTDKVQSRSSYYRLGIADETGLATTSDGYNFDISEMEYFKSAIKGKQSVSDTFLDPFDNTYSLGFSAPITINGNVRFVIFGTYSIDDYIETLSTPTFDGNGFSYVIDNQGHCVIGSTHKDSHGKYFDNFFDEVLKLSPKNKKAVEKMKMDLIVGESDSVFIRSDLSRYLYYKPLNINNWYLLTVVPKNIMTAYTNQILICGYLFILFCISIFCILIKNTFQLRQLSRKELEKLAYVDALTGGMSFTKFKYEAELIISKDPNIKRAILNLDINNFQYINDIFGYDEGDNALRYIWSELSKSLSDNELCSRIFDDHFVVLISFKDKESLDTRLNEFFNRLKNYKPQKGIYNMTISVGVYLIKNANMTVDAMINRARIPQKQIKGLSSKSTYAIYDSKQREDIIFRKELENSFDSAIENKEFKVYYQPKFNIESKQFKGAEALVRWNNNSGTVLLPSKFISLFEKNGDIVALDNYVLKETCQNIKTWIDKGYVVEPISVNVSLLQLIDKNFVKDFVGTIKKYDIPLSLIEIEFTESIMAENEELLLSLTNQLNDYGIKVLLDDFGSGYSSLNMLNVLPFNVVKLDKRFIGDLETDKKSQAIVSSAISLAHTLNMQVTAEGVETKKQYDILSSMGCDSIQGYYCAKPMPKDEYEKVLSNPKKRVD